MKGIRRLFLNRGLRAKLHLGFGGVLILLVLVAWISWRSLDHDAAGLAAYRVLEHDRDLLTQLQASLLTLHMNARDAVVCGMTPEETREFQRHRRTVEERMAEARDRIAGPARERLLEAAAQGLRSHADCLANAVRLQRLGTKEQAVPEDPRSGISEGDQAVRAKLDLINATMLARIEEADRSLRAEQAKMADRLKEANHRAVAALLGLSGVGTAAGLLLMWSIGQSIAKRIRASVEALSFCADQLRAAAETTARIIEESKPHARKPEEADSPPPAVTNELGSLAEELTHAVDGDTGNRHQGRDAGAPRATSRDLDDASRALRVQDGPANALAPPKAKGTVVPPEHVFPLDDEDLSEV